MLDAKYVASHLENALEVSSLNQAIIACLGENEASTLFTIDVYQYYFHRKANLVGIADMWPDLYRYYHSYRMC